MPRNATYSMDGCVVGYGRHTLDDNVAGVTNTVGGAKVMTVEIVGTELVDTFAAANIKPQAARIKRGSRILSASLVVTEAFDALTSLDVGTWGTGEYAQGASGGSSTAAVDVADGIFSAILLADIALAKVVAGDGTLVGGTITVGATSNSDCVIAPSRNGTVPTVGKATLTIEYIEPIAEKAAF